MALGFCIAGYLVTALIVYSLMYVNSVDFNFRVDAKKNLYREAFRCWKEDFLGIHCPWSRGKSTRYRIERLKSIIGPYGKLHEKRGFMTLTDLEDESQREVIARDCFVSKSCFWLEHFIRFITAPLLLVLMLVITIVALFDRSWEFLKEKLLSWRT